MLVIRVFSVVLMVTTSRQAVIGISHVPSEVVEDPSEMSASTTSSFILAKKYPSHYVFYQLTPEDTINSMYESRHIGRSIRETSSREGRLLLKVAAKQLSNLFLWGGVLANSAGTGTVAATNSFNVFGKTINSALSLAYGDRGVLPPFVVPPYVPPPFGPGPFGLPLGTTTTTALAATRGVSPTPINDDAVVTAGENSQRQLFEQYLDMERMKQKILSDPIYFAPNRPDQRFQYNANLNDQWKQFLKQNNLKVNQYSDDLYVQIPKVNEV